MKKNNGFTLIELMIALVISSLSVSGIYGVYTIQQRSYTAQEQVTEMQQQLRSAVDFMSRDIRMIGYDPGKVCGVNPDGILIREPERFSFEYCNQMTLHRVTYAMNGSRLQRNLTLSGSGQTLDLADGVDGLEFRYLQEDGLTLATGVTDVRILQVSILIRSANPDPHQTDTLQYIPASGTAWPSLKSGVGNPPNDNFHRRLLVTSIELRNIGL